MPLRAQRDACLLMLGIDPTDCEWDHSPALHLREWDEEAQDTIPAANDPRYITPRPMARGLRQQEATRTVLPR